MKVLGYQSDNVLSNLGTYSLVTLFYIGSLVLLILLLITFKVNEYHKGVRYTLKFIVSIVVTLITMSRDTQTE